MKLSWLSKHPWDWGLHFLFSFIPVYCGWCEWFVMGSFGILVEAEQKSQVWYDPLHWKTYFTKHALGDLIADFLGIALALILRR